MVPREISQCAVISGSAEKQKKKSEEKEGGGGRYPEGAVAGSLLAQM